MNNDDLQRGASLSRRSALKVLGVTGLSFLAACVAGSPGKFLTPTAAQPSSTPAAVPGTGLACIARPALTEGPYYVNEPLNRSDIRSDPASGALRPGVPLTLGFIVSHMNNGACAPLSGARIDVWHCDASGVYSDVSDPSFNTRGQKFLRGFQITDDNGMAKFLTIYPGWYSGRTVHIHFKVYQDLSAQGTAFTSQLFLDDALTDKVFAQPPYSSHGPRDTRNSSDSFFNSQMLLPAVPAGSGYAGTFILGVQLT